MSIKPKNNFLQRKDIEHLRLVSLINSMADGVLAVDEHAKVVMFNGAALDVLDVNNIKAKSALKQILKPIDKNGQAVDITQMVQSTTTQVTNRDLRLQYSDGSYINLYLSIAPVHLGYGSVGGRGYVLLLRDITREKSLEEERDEFISVVSHELRTPIAIAEGNLSNVVFLSQKHDLPQPINEAIKQSYDQIILLASMINDLSTLSRAERGVLKIEPEDINVNEMITLLAKEYTASASAKNLQVKTDIDPNLELLHSSKLYVREILQNFITNSIKYTQSGYILIAAKSANGGVQFEVSDTGIGISKADQERVFDKFFRSEDYRTRQSNGTGLGLYVTMKLTRILNASIDLESKLNEGSTFKIFVPNI
ncbi:PAS domain S-box protein, partial [Candidatus Saccharibacteria bacterium]|nr:PAS domain S-box protein [Candidatus Saccharibacteria bacterium]